MPRNDFWGGNREWEEECSLCDAWGSLAECIHCGLKHCLYHSIRDDKDSSISKDKCICIDCWKECHSNDQKST